VVTRDGGKTKTLPFRDLDGSSLVPLMFDHS